jgi:SAM-dependent methyltransferase
MNKPSARLPTRSRSAERAPRAPELRTGCQVHALSSAANFSTWNRKEIAGEYVAASELQAPERTILALLRHELAGMKMLDIGVGAGRTTIHFAGLVQEYWGIDYSGAMIDLCRARFPQPGAGVRLAVCDARNMNICLDRFFDFILFSYNGIDYVSHDERLRILAEIARVGRAGAYFCFSTHNLRGGLRRLEFPALSGSLTGRVQKIWEWLLLRGWHNRVFSLSGLRDLRYTVLNDGVHGNGLLTYYIRPTAQIEQLRSLGFENMRVYRLDTGELVSDESTLDEIDDPWLYYLCMIP